MTAKPGCGNNRRCHRSVHCLRKYLTTSLSDLVVSGVVYILSVWRRIQAMLHWLAERDVWLDSVSLNTNATNGLLDALVLRFGTTGGNHYYAIYEHIQQFIAKPRIPFN